MQRNSILLTDSLLDFYPNASAAFSLRRLSKNYLGPCIRVKRDSDQAEQDIGFIGMVLDTEALLNFVGSANGRVYRWYDQSGNDLVCRLPNNSVPGPEIVQNGVLVTDEGQPALDFVGGANGFYDEIQLFNPSNDHSVFIVAKQKTGVQDEGILIQQAQSGVRFAFGQSIGQLNSFSIQRPGAVNTIFPAGDRFLAYGSVTPVQELYMNNIKDSGTLACRSNTTANRIGNAFSSFSWTGFCQEIVSYQLDQSSNRLLIQNEINNYYSIF